jgi:hypothetical protein
MGKDEEVKMTVSIFHPVTNKKFEAYKTEELDSELKEAIKAYECKHESIKLIRHFIKNGSVQIKKACVNCGESFSSPIKKEPCHDDLDAYNLEDVRKKYEIEKFEIQKNIILKYNENQNKSVSDWWKEYDIYLSSKEWKEKRELKLTERDYLCEGCGKEEATEVHHTPNSYDRIPYEMLFELRALCSFCHSMLHLDKPRRINYLKNKNIDIELPCCGCRHQDEKHGRHWCGVHNVPAEVSLKAETFCGPKRKSQEGLK